MSMKCIHCGKAARCIDSRPHGSNIYITRRRYRCQSKPCQKRWTTYEQPGESAVDVRHALRDEALDVLIMRLQNMKGGH